MACWLQPQRCNLCEGEGMWAHTSRRTRFKTTILTDGNTDVTGKTKEDPNPSPCVRLTPTPASYTLICWPRLHRQTPEGRTTHNAKVKKTGEIVTTWNFCSVRNSNIFMSAEGKWNLKRLLQNWSYENIWWKFYILIICSGSLKMSKLPKCNKAYSKHENYTTHNKKPQDRKSVV